MAEELRVTVEHGVAHVVLDRPPVNALTPELMRRITVTFDEIGASRQARAAVLSARGNVFCAGSDVRSRAGSAAGTGAEADYNRLAREVHGSIVDCRVPVVAAVQGHALGGGLCLVAACDLVVVGNGAVFALPEIDVGLLGGAAWAARLVGQRWARRLMLTGERVRASDLVSAGAFDAVLVDDDPVDRALALARSLAAKSPAAVTLAKQALNDIEHMELRAAYRHEQSFTARLRGHPDSAEAMAAFREKRAPRFQDGPV